jgi:hypothetical protein
MITETILSYKVGTDDHSMITETILSYRVGTDDLCITFLRRPRYGGKNQRSIEVSVKEDDPIVIAIRKLEMSYDGEH